MKSSIISIFIFLAITNGYFAVNFKCGTKPNWKYGIDKMFKKQCIKYNQWPNSCQGVHLAHVVSWSAICHKAENLYNRRHFAAMETMVTVLFRIDTNAHVWTGPANPKKSLSHEVYMEKAIKDKSEKIFREAKQIVNDWAKGKNINDDATVSSFRSLVNSAPANLRYGNGGLNSGIGSAMDPMGDQNQKMTRKERYMNTLFGSSFQCKATKCKKCNCENTCQTSSASKDGINFYVCK